MENNANPVTHVDVDNTGIRVGTTFYEYSSLVSYAIVYVRDTPIYLRITPRKKLSTVIDIPLTPDVDAVELRNYLSGQLEEEKNAQLSNSDVLIHAMRL